jgi:hypothetical protein
VDSYKQKISHLNALYHLACADKEATKVELTFIKNVAERLGVSLSEMKKLDSGEPDLELPDKEYKIYSLFHRLALILMIDESVNEKEKHYCFNLGIKMGLHPNAVGEIIAHVAEHGTMKTTPAAVMGIFRKYMN